MSTWFRAIFNRATVTLYFSGAVILALALYIEVSGIPNSIWLERFCRLLGPLGFSLLITAIVASVLNHSFQLTIENRFAIIKGAEGARVIRIYANREAALEEINIEAQRANRKIDILCIAGTDLLQPRTAMLDEIGRRFQDRSGVKVRILILDPRSRYAVERSLREENQNFSIKNYQEFDYPNKKLCEDTLLALRQLHKIIDISAKCHPAPFELAVRLYNSAPMMMYLALDDRIFLEQYHLGIPKSQMGPFTKCLGKAVPIIEVSVFSELGDVLSGHFDYLWDRSSGRELSDDSYDKISASLKSIDWLNEMFQVDIKDESDLAL
jgi:hypothetical protein